THWSIKLQACDYEITHWAEAAHQNTDDFLCLTTVVLVSYMAINLDKKLLETFFVGEEFLINKGQLHKLCENS
ncbi:hypothetical protein DSO57_1003458, partial [Entomophthora muscae]